MNILLSYSGELFKSQRNILVDEFLIFFRLNKLEAEKLRILVKWDKSTKIINQIKIAESIELQNIDKLFTFDFPSIFIRHSNKVVYISDSLVEQLNNFFSAEFTENQELSSDHFTNFLLQRIVSELRTSSLIILSSDKVAEFLARYIKIDENNSIKFVSEENLLSALILQNQESKLEINQNSQLNKLISFFDT
jgi:hypothetical protein